MLNLHKTCTYITFLIWALLTGLAEATALSQQDAVLRAITWMSSNPVMSKTSGTVASVSTFPENASYFVYVVELSPKGYLILNSDSRLPLMVAFSADAGVDLSDDPQNALRAMLLGYCERTEQTLNDMTRLPLAMAAAGGGGDELYGPFLETSWNQNAPYNLLCPVVGEDTNSYDGRAPVGCVPVAYAQILNYHRWPVHGTGSHAYTDSEGSINGSHSADFSDAYDWVNMKASHSPLDSQAEQNAIAELMGELCVAAEVNYEPTLTSASTENAGHRLGEYFFFEEIVAHDSQAELIAPVEAELRAGFPCIVAYPGHAFIADGLMVDNGVTTYHFNMGWGGSNNGWYSKDLVPTAGGGSSYLDDGITSLRPALMAFPESGAVAATNGSAELNWILPKRREAEVSQLAIKNLEQQSGQWSSDASEITGPNSGWALVSAGRSGDCWFAGPSGPSLMVLNELFVPDASSQLNFWQFARIAGATFTVDVSADGGQTFSSIYSESFEYDYSWSQTVVSLADYAGQEVVLRFALSSGSWYTSGDWRGIRIDDLSITSGDWYDWELFATDSTLASDRFFEVTTMWDDCDDFSVFEVTSTSDYKDWVVSTTGGVDHCFYKQPGGYTNHRYHLSSRSAITPTASTRLVLRGKYKAVYDESFRVMISTDRVEFLEIWSVQGSADWSDMVIDLSAYTGQAIYVRLEYLTGSHYSDSGVWIDSISTQEITNPELEGQPVHYTTLTNLSAGSYTLAAILTDTNAVEHAAGPSFSLVVSGPANDNDRDGDDLPDEWELQYFGGETKAKPSAMAANGMNTVMEAYIADINPTNPASFFEASANRGNGFAVSWNSVSGRVYSVHSTSNLLENFQPLETNILWPQNSWTDTVERTDIFYKIDVSLP